MATNHRYERRHETWRLRMIGLDHRVQRLEMDLELARAERAWAIREVRRRTRWSFERIAAMTGMTSERVRQIVRTDPGQLGRIDAEHRAAGRDRMWAATWMDLPDD